MQFSTLSSPHGGVVHDIAFDYYGNRFASCSSDRCLKVWDLDERTGAWSPCDIPRAHQDSIWRLSWAHPEFGQLLASCSEDKSVHIWEEQEPVNAGDGESKGRWQKKVQLSDSKKSVNDVKFSPRYLGLKLATASADGMVRIYEASDVFSLNYWPMQDSFQAEVTAGSDSVSEHGATCLSWSDCPFEHPKLVVGGYSKSASVWTYEESKWQKEFILDHHGEAVHDVAWAPSMGRSYHLIATAGRGPSFKVHTLVRNSGILSYEPGSSETIETTSPVWRVAWNVTGTVLATSGEDGTLSLWRKNFAGKWNNVQNLPSGNLPATRNFFQNP